MAGWQQTLTPFGKKRVNFIRLKTKAQKYSKLKITCNNKQIHSTDSVTYLGAELDQSLSGEAMGSKFIKKAGSRL